MSDFTYKHISRSTGSMTLEDLEGIKAGDELFAIQKMKEIVAKSEEAAHKTLTGNKQAYSMLRKDMTDTIKLSNITRDKLRHKFGHGGNPDGIIDAMIKRQKQILEENARKNVEASDEVVERQIQMLKDAESKRREQREQKERERASDS